MARGHSLDEVLAEIDRRSNEPLKTYNRVRKHVKQMDFHRSRARIRWVFGGNRSGKTECGAVETVWLALGIHPYRVNLPNTVGWVVSLSTQVQRDVAQEKILRYLPKRDIADMVMVSGAKGAPERGVIDFILVRNVFGGLSKIGFKSCDQGREKFQGASLDYVWFDEEPPEDVFEECRMRVLDRAGILYGTMTPLKGRTWVYDKIYLSSDPDIWWVNMEWADNPYLDADEVRYMTESMSEEELRSRRYGQFDARGGLVYPEFDPSVHVIEPFAVPKEWFSMISIDPGLRNPLSAHWYAVDGDGVVFVIAEHYEAGREIAYHADRILEISKRLGWRTDAKGRVSALMDSAANQHTLNASKSVSELFYEYGIMADTRVNKDVFSGIARVKASLKSASGRPSLFIFSTCVKMIEEIKGYVWGEGDSPIKLNDHAMDELRYFICSRPSPYKPLRAEKTLVQLDKERLMKKSGGYYGL